MRRAFSCLSAVLAALCFPAALLAAQQTPPDEEAVLAAEASRREAVLVAAVKNVHKLPTPGVMPRSDEIPLGEAWEDPEWNTPLMQSIYRNPYSYGNNLDNYQACLGEALGGNPRAMLALSMYCYLWGDVLEDQYPGLPRQAHSAAFWRGWAERLTSPGWVALRLGDLHGRWPSSSLEFYRQSAELGSAEGMYNYYNITGKRLDYLYRSAALGHAKSAFMLGEELEKRGGADNLAAARSYTWLAAAGADEWGLLHSSFAFYNDEFGAQAGGRADNCEQGYLYAILNIRYQQSGLSATQRPENICMLAPEAVSRLEAAADRWQADYDQRRLPYILRLRYRNAPLIDALQAELPALAVIRQAGESRSRTGQGAAGMRQPEAGRIPVVAWHLGFFSEGGETRRSEQAAGAAPLRNPMAGREFAASLGERLGLEPGREIFWVYAFVLLCIFMGAGFIIYSQIKKREKKRQRKKSAGAARPRPRPVTMQS